MIQMDADQRIEDLLITLSDMDLSGIKMLAENTRGIAEVAYAICLEGGVVSLAALLMVVPDKLTESFIVLKQDGSLTSQEKMTIYNSLIKEALLLCRNEGSVKRWKLVGLLTSIEQRKLLLLEIELLQLFGAAVLQGSSNTDKHPLSPLIRASQAGDEEVVKLLLRTNINVNEIDEEGYNAQKSYKKSLYLSEHS